MALPETNLSKNPASYMNKELKYTEREIRLEIRPIAVQNISREAKPQIER